MTEQEQFKELVEILRKLRAPDGCPWDRVQTHRSLRPCLTEETAEFLASVRIYEETGDAENMREELGDLLLQVIMHSIIAEEEKLFTLEEVIAVEKEKMIRRHPHIFADGAADTPQQVLQNWEEIKKEEKKGKAWIKSPLREIPEELPALARATKVIKKADKLYQYQEGRELSHIQKEAEGLLSVLCEDKEGGKDAEGEKAFGELLWRLCELGYQKGYGAEQILADFTAEKISAIEPET